MSLGGPHAGARKTGNTARAGLIVVVVTQVRYPAMRAEVMSALRSLSAVRALEDSGRDNPHALHYDWLDFSVHILYDDCEVLPDPTIAVPHILHSSEAEAFSALEAQLGPMLDQLGDVPSTEYTADSRWPRVMSAARAALQTMRLSEPPTD